jgi:esterase/lipase
VRELQVNDKFYYFYGKFESIEKGNEVLSELKEKGYDDAFITGFSLGQKMNAELLEKLLKS